MAQTRRRRQTKHRGNAAGVVESRGRTGRKPTAEEKNPVTRQASKSREQRLRDRDDRPPTWRGSFYRAMIMAVVLLGVILIFKIGSSSSAIALFPIVLIAYWPISYYSERWVYNRKQRNKAAARARKGGR
jgi:hypothetical protein